MQRHAWALMTAFISSSHRGVDRLGAGPAAWPCCGRIAFCHAKSSRFASTGLDSKLSTDLVAQGRVQQLGNVAGQGADDFGAVLGRGDDGAAGGSAAGIRITHAQGLWSHISSHTCGNTWCRSRQNHAWGATAELEGSSA